MSSELFDPVKTQAKDTKEVLVGFSCGKDSIVTLDLCFRHFDRVQPFFMSYVPGMEFQEAVIRKYERKYGVNCIRIPHFETSDFFRYGTYREEDPHVPIVSIRDVYAYLRNETGIYWIACGERIADSIVRRAMLKKSGSIDEKRGRFFPLIYWTKGNVMDYVRVHGLRLPREYDKIQHSFRSLSDEDVAMVKNFFPEDYKKLLGLYPLAEAAAFREEQRHAKQVSDV